MPAANAPNRNQGIASYDYAFVRIVPHVEREEFLNVGVILYCRTKRYLDAQVALDPERFLAIVPHFDEHLLQLFKTHIELIPQICAGAGPIGALEQAERFHWLVAPRSASIQVSAVHSGLCIDPQAALDELFMTHVIIS
ncbi:DUF3037 domain-containing protein [Chloroflexi bacterium TSY]|nr:DUF3037 domain-containing protein [Chloroflexi bacterium TSY]